MKRSAIFLLFSMMIVQFCYAQFVIINSKNNRIYWDSDAKLGRVENEKHEAGLVDQINNVDNLVLPMRYKYIRWQVGFIEVETLDGKYGLYDLQYRKLYDEVYANELLCWHKMAGVPLNKGGKRVSKYTATELVGGKWGVGDWKGNIVVPIKYDFIDISWDEEKKNIMTMVSTGGHFDKKGERYLDGKKWGLYKNDKIVVPCEYDTLDTAKEDNIYMIKKNGKWGFYADGKEIIAPQYDAVTSFVNGVATVRKDGEVRMIKNPLRNDDGVEIASGGPAINNKKEQGPVVSRYPKPDSDVDKNIPVAKKQADNTFAFIICNENYPDAPVPYSLNDGRMFKEYCQKALGLPEKNINMYEDATYGNIITAVEKMKSIADAYEGEASVIFYYAGHGFPDDKQATAYLLPIDGDASSITTTGYSLAKLYKEIANLKLNFSVVFLDACFSGAKREDQMLASSRGVAIKVKEEAPQGKMVVFSAAQGDETAHQMEEKHHGLFTYFLLKELQDTQGDVDLGTLTDYVTKQVKRQSVVINNKKQTPTVVPSASIGETWRSMKLK